MQKIRTCEKCGAILVAGKNWYQLKGDYICCNCSGYPNYSKNFRTWNPVAYDTGDYADYCESVILNSMGSDYDEV